MLKSLAACALLYSAVSTYTGGSGSSNMMPRRQLTMVGDSIPSYMDPLMKDLRERKKLFDETPPEEVKYWFEYTGKLQVSTLYYYELELRACICFGAFGRTYCAFYISFVLTLFHVLSIEILLSLFQISWQGGLL